MKKAVSILLSLAMAASLAACGQSSQQNETTTAAPAETEAQAEQPSESAAETPAETEAPAEKPANQLVYGVTSNMSGDMGLKNWSSLGGDLPVLYLVDAMTLATYDQNALWQWDKTVVKDVEQVSNEDGTLTFNVELNDGLKFSDGSPITAKNYIAYPLLFSSPAAVSVQSYGTAGKEYVGHADYRDGKSATFSGIRMQDDLHFSITVGSDYNPYYYGQSLLQIWPIYFQQWLPEGNWDIVDDGEGCYFKGDVEFNAENCAQAITDGRYLYKNRVCSGPYKLDSWDVGANEAVLKINENYPGNFEGQKASIETVIVRLVNSATMLDALKTGSVDLIDGIGEGDLINACYDLAEDGAFVADSYKYSGYMKLFYQCDWGPTQYESVRKAIAYLTNREEMTQEATKGYGNVTNGQYSFAQWMAQDMEEELASELEAYPYDPAKAVEILKEDGWVYNADGTDYVDGSGQVRYKKVSEEETAYMDNCVQVDGQWYMPLSIKYLGHAEGDGIETVLDELLTIYLIENKSTAEAGMEFNKTVMADSELLSYLNRRGSNGEEKYTKPSYNVISLASGLGGAKFDKTYSWTSDEAMIQNNKNRYFNEKLDKLSMDMLYSVEAGDDQKFEEIWFEYQKEFNAHLPEVPLFNWTYCTVYNSKIKNFEITNIWTAYYAIPYATIE